MPRAFLIKHKKEKKGEKRKATAEPVDSQQEKRIATGNDVHKKSGYEEEPRELASGQFTVDSPVKVNLKATARDAKPTSAGDHRSSSKELLRLVTWPKATTDCTADSPFGDSRPESRGDITPTPSTPSPGPHSSPSTTPHSPLAYSPGAPVYHLPHMGSPQSHQAEQRRREQLLWQSGYLRFPPSPPVAAPHIHLEHRYRLGGGPGMIPTSLPLFNPLLAPGHVATPDPRRMFPHNPTSTHVPRPSFSPHSHSHPQPIDLKLPSVRPASHDSYPRSVREFETNRDGDADKNPSDVENQMPMELLATSCEGKKKPGPPRFQCDACKKSYSTFNGLSKHKEFHCTSHVKREFSCQHCDKNYTSLGALKMHIRTHTLPCKCKLCGKAFSRPWLLQGHVRTHTGEKPFTCTHCGRSFADRSNLRAHLQTHTDIKKYNCKSCAKTFSRMSLLLKHQEGSCLGLVR